MKRTGENSKRRKPCAPFYFPDWQADIELGLCSGAARGVWMECLCIMHAAEPRGVLLINGKRPTMAQLAVVARLPEEVVRAGVEELIANGVCDVREDGALVCRRMKRDGEQAERFAEYGRMGGNPALLAADAGVDAVLTNEDKKAKAAARARIYRERKAERTSRSARDASRDASVTRHVTERDASHAQKRDAPRQNPSAPRDAEPVTGVNPPDKPFTLSFSSSNSSSEPLSQEAPRGAHAGPPSPMTGVGPAVAPQPASDDATEREQGREGARASPSAQARQAERAAAKTAAAERRRAALAALGNVVPMNSEAA